MFDKNEVALTVHGLPVDNGNVRAEVFLTKFQALLKSLKVADKHLNQKAAHNYLVVDLRKASAHATLRETVSRRGGLPDDSIPFVGAALRAIYNGERSVGRFPLGLIQTLAVLPAGVDRTFSHAEIAFSSDNVVRIDDYLARQMERAIARATGGGKEEKEPFFEGVSYGTFDGVLKELDSRGVIVRGKLVLSIGSKEIDCVFQRNDIQALRDSFEKRARVDALAHYDGLSPLPVRLDVRKINLVAEGGNLVQWAGALKRRRGATGGL